MVEQTEEADLRGIGDKKAPAVKAQVVAGGDQAVACDCGGGEVGGDDAQGPLV